MARYFTTSLGTKLTAGFASFLVGFMLGGWLLDWSVEGATISGNACVSGGSGPSGGLLEDDEGNFTSFDADALWWSDGSSDGYGTPSCLSGNATPPFYECAEVRAGTVWVEHPGSDGDEQVVWMECP